MDNEPYGNLTLTMDRDIEEIDVTLITVNSNVVTIGKPQEQIKFGVTNKNGRESDELANNLYDYLTSDNQTFEKQIEQFLVKLDGMSDISTQIKILPECWLTEINFERRVDYIDNLAANPDKNIYFKIDLINTFQPDKESVIDLFNALNTKSNIGKNICNPSEWTNKELYKKLVETLIFQYYKNLIKDAAYDQLTSSYLFKWYKSRNYSVLYSNTYTSDNKIEFSADLDYLVNNENDRERIMYEYPTKISPFSTIGVDFSTGVDFVGVEGYVLPMPAFYFNWIINEYDRIEMQKAINVTIYAASFCFGVGEIATANKAWKTAVAIVGLVHSSGKLYFQLNDNVVKSLQSSRNGRAFLFAWNSIGTVLNVVNITDNLVNLNFPLFVSLTMAWDNLSDEERETLEELLNTEDYNHLKGIINICKQ